MSATPLNIFIGSGEASVLERKTLIYSLRKHTQRPLDIYVFNGTHNSIERNDEPPVPAGMSLKVKYQNVTEFSSYRFLIPHILGYQGKAVFLDSDMICLGDIGELYDSLGEDYDFLAKSDSYPDMPFRAWGLSVMVINCKKSRFNLERYFDEIEAGQYTYADLHQMSPVFLARYPFKIGEIDPAWNVFDKQDTGTKLIHYTNLFTQPWKYYNHPYGELWFQYFNEARSSGFITDRDIELSIVRYHVRRDILAGNRNSTEIRSLQKRKPLLKRFFQKLIR